MKKQHTKRSAMILTPAALAATGGAGGSIGGFNGRHDLALVPSIGIGNMLELAGGIGGTSGGGGLLNGGVIAGGGGLGRHDAP